MEHGPFIDDFPIKTSIYKGFSMAMLNNQRATINFTNWVPWLQTKPPFYCDGLKPTGRYFYSETIQSSPRRWGGDP